MEIKGQIEEMIYQNEVNSYTVARLKTEDDVITITGYLPFINSGDVLRLEGKMIIHKDYGEQFEISTFEKVMPEGVEALERYLACGNLTGVGPTTAKRIVDKFGEETIHVLKFEPHKLANIKGINEEKAQKISDEFNENWDLWQIASFLERFGISMANAKKIYNLFGKNAIAEIEENPYVLVDNIHGVDFKQIDKMAIDMGIVYNNEKRITSGIKYSLIIASYNGHCAVLENNLIQFVHELLGVEEEDIENAIISLKVKGDIIIEEVSNNNWVYLYPFYKAEVNIASKIMTLKNSKNIKSIKNFELEIKKEEEASSITFSNEQIDAIRQINDNNVCIITGGPGTGKTTIIKGIIDIYERHKYKVALCAPTGRAAKRMTETTGKEAKTLHRLLEIKKLEEDVFETVDNDFTPIDADVIVVDEVSMVDVFLMNCLLKAIYQGTKLILVGDIDQLPSVGPGSVLKDLINSEKISTIILNKIFRQAALSQIVTNAHRVNNGEGFIQDTNKELNEDFFYIQQTDNNIILRRSNKSM